MGVLNALALRSAGIEISEQVATLEELNMECPQARILAQHLLSFKHIISHERWEDIDENTQALLSKSERDHIRIPEKRPHEKAYPLKKKQFDKRYNIKHNDMIFDRASRIKEKADNIQSKDEDRWTEVIKGIIFKGLIDKARNAESGQNKPRAVDVINRFRVESNHTWTFGKRVLREYCQKTSHKLKAPKPDLFFSFHAFMRGDTECGPLNGDGYIDNFGMTRLTQLYEDYQDISKGHKDRKFGFNPSPCKEFYHETSFKDRTCFPWLVCEWKHHGHIGTSYENYLHFQAANAAAVCLTLFANAATGGRPFPDLHEIRPVVCITFTGPKIKVWIAYVTEIEDGRYKYRMQCIWNGNLKNVLDNVKLCVIIENLHFWAMNHLRPWLFSCIEQWIRSIDELRNAEDDVSDSAQSDSSSNFAFRRADTLDNFLVHDSDSEYYADSYVDSEGLEYGEGHEDDDDQDESDEELYDEGDAEEIVSLRLRNL